MGQRAERCRRGERPVTAPIRIRARSRDAMTEVTVLMPHPMETGFRRGPDGGLIAAHYIKHMRVVAGERTVLEAELGPSVSRDPLFSFRFAGGREGERVSVTWTDTAGARRTDSATIG
jgi:sulfur-oxidizing protein SoxZ